MKNNIVRNILFISSLVIVSQLIVSAQTPCTTLGIRMSIGSKDTIASHDVFNMQLFLQSRGYFSGEPTGYFGGLTKKAVQVFQKDNTIDQTGVVGTLTRAKIKALSCGTIVTSAGTTASQGKSSTATSSFLDKIYTSSTTVQKNIANSGTSTTTAVYVPKVVFAKYQAFVNGRVQIDASSVTKEYAYISCKNVVYEGKELNTVTCTWNGFDLYSFIPAITDTTSPATYQGAPFATLLVSPTSVPYQGGYSTFELKSSGMKSCTLYYKDEPSTQWVMADSSLGTNYTLPGYTGMTKSRSYYSSCIDINGNKVDSNIVFISVAKQ